MNIMHINKQHNFTYLNQKCIFKNIILNKKYLGIFPNVIIYFSFFPYFVRLLDELKVKMNDWINELINIIL